MQSGLLSAVYIAAAILFILSLGGLAHQESARRGIWYGISGMLLAVLASMFVASGGYVWMIVALLAGGVIGAIVAKRVEMTGMPQLVAALHSLVGLAAVFVGFGAELELRYLQNVSLFDFDLRLLQGFALQLMKKTPAEIAIMKGEIFLGLFIGAVTFTGSIVAYGKLSGRISGKPLLLPHRHHLNVALGVLALAAGIIYLLTGSLFAMLVVTLVAGLIGVHLIMAIGGADMPVVVSMLNSYSGWAAAAIGFTLGNDLLIVTGALVGASGAILSYIMCKAMNRHFLSVILGGFGGTPVASAAIEGESIPIEGENVAQALRAAQSVVIVPGYGMAVARAQNAVSELTSKLRAASKTVRFAIHPVAGRLPGHMNVLLAEARVPYDIVFEMDEINADFPQTDVVIVIGANDIVNPSALEDPASPIAGMPVLEVWKARQVFICKRGQGTGYSGIENPLFYKENARMFYGDAKQSMESLLRFLG